MSKNRITEGLKWSESKQSWYLDEIINGKRCFFTSRDPQTVWDKRDQAIVEASRIKTEVDLGPLFETVADEYRLQVDKMKYGTQRTYYPAIDRAIERFKNKHMREIEPYMISEFLRSLSGMARTTVSNQKTVINAIFQTWIDSPVWRGDQNPSKIVSIPRGLKKTKRQPPTDDQVKIVKESLNDPEALPAILYLCTGERRGEACAIQLKDIDFENKTITINKAIEFRNNKPHVKGTKTEAGDRKIPLLSMLENVLQPMRNLDPETYILSGRTEPLKWSEYDKKWNQFWKKHGMAHEIKEKQKKIRHGKEFIYEVSRWRANVVAHQFRHEYVCMLCMAGVPEEVTIQLVGHANSQMIHEVYMSLKPQMIKDAAKKLDSFLKGI